MRERLKQIARTAATRACRKLLDRMVEYKLGAEERPQSFGVYEVVLPSGKTHRQTMHASGLTCAKCNDRPAVKFDFPDFPVPIVTFCPTCFDDAFAKAEGEVRRHIEAQRTWN